ncbi:hypothetical protein ACSQ67_025826 [Phaseolus vulgaris]
MSNGHECPLDKTSEAGKDWRYVYKALAVIEYLVAHGCERAVDDIIEHTFHFSALSSFEYVEPSGKDVGLNARKKDENIVSLLNDRYIGVSEQMVSMEALDLEMVTRFGDNNRDKVGSYDEDYRLLV